MASPSPSGEEEAHPLHLHLHGDILDSIISHLPSLHLLPAAHVSKSWRLAVSSALRRRLPFLLFHLPSLTFAFDPHSHSWTPIPTTTTTDLLASSHPGLLHSLTFSTLSFSTDPFATSWLSAPAPRAWRSNPILALVGRRLVAAGGTCDFNDDPCTVELYADGVWSPSQPMPDAFRHRATATFLSVAVSGVGAMHVLDRSMGWFATFDVEKGEWGEVGRVRPEERVFAAAVGVAGGERVVVVGAMGEAGRVEGVGVWEVDVRTLGCVEMGRMPAAAVERVVGEGMWEVGLACVGECGYVYNASEMGEVVMCDFGGGGTGGGGGCTWEVIGYPAAAVAEEEVVKLVVGCGMVGVGDLCKLGKLFHGSLLRSWDPESDSVLG